MQSSHFTSPGACPLPPARTGSRQRGLTRYAKDLLSFFFRFGLCPLCITASVGYGLYRLAARAFSSSSTTPADAKS